MKKLRVVVLMLPPALALVGLFVVPMLSMGLFSFRAGTFGAERQVYTLENYQLFLHNQSYQNLLWRSSLVALETSIYSVLLAYPVAYFLAFKAGRRRLTLLTILLVPAWTSYLLRILA
jgi:spermidine/putrescine transport system permease protein